MQQLLDRAEVCDRLGVSLRTLDGLISSGQITPVRIGALVRFAPSDLDAFVAGHRDVRHDVTTYLERLESLLPDMSHEQREQLSVRLHSVA